MTLAFAVAALSVTSCKHEDPITVDVTPAAPVVSADIQDITIKVTTNASSWSAKIESTHIKLSRTDIDNGTITLTTDFNSGTSERIDSLIITASDVIKAIPVKQLPLSSILSTSNVLLKGTEETEINISSVHPWTISYGKGVDWFSVSPTTGFGPATVKIRANSEYIDVGQRTGLIQVKLNGKNNSVNVTQGQKDVIYLADESEEINVECSKSEVTIGTRTNVSYDVEIDEAAKSWITYVPSSKALHEYNEVFRVSSNPSFDQREGTIIFKYGDELTQKVKVIQKGMDPILKETVPGIYAPSGNTLYEAGKVQLRRSYTGSNVIFSMLYPTEIRAIDFTGLDSKLSEGDKISIKVIVRTENNVESTQQYEAIVLKAENNFVWLKSGDYGFIVKN